jgi:hypothetical protein
LQFRFFHCLSPEAGLRISCLWRNEQNGRELRGPALQGIPEGVKLPDEADHYLRRVVLLDLMNDATRILSSTEYDGASAAAVPFAGDYNDTS